MRYLVVRTRESTISMVGSGAEGVCKYWELVYEGLQICCVVDISGHLRSIGNGDCLSKRISNAILCRWKEAFQKVENSKRKGRDYKTMSESFGYDVCLSSRR